ncbi:MAG TPA: histidinol dehydrogenase, partial [Candidatus Latescibacteria bacterium]|nr:histidinol dehydrogenase [Candidatus Latescibacterota bacterium]
MIDIISYSAAESPVGKLAAILDRRDGQPADVEVAVQEILRQVRASGDAAVVEYTSRFDGVTMTPQSMRVSAKALADAGEAMDPALLAAVRAAAANIRAFHQKQHTNSWFTEDGDGVILGKRVTPLRRVGICVPGGQAPLISSLLMAAIPAQVAGVEEICVVT